VARRGYEIKIDSHEERYKYNPTSDFNRQHPMRVSYTDFYKQPVRNTEATLLAGVDMQTFCITTDRDKK